MIKQQILHNFNQHVQSYDTHAQIQAHAAHHLASLVEHQGRADSILEIGCGTGLLTNHLSKTKPSLYLVSDISKAMVRHCQQRIPQNNFLVMDGELLAIDCTFDLIVSNFTFQWFTQIQNSLLELLSYGRTLAFSVPGPKTFQQWVDLCQTYNLPCGIQHFPSLDDYSRIFKNHRIRHMENEQHLVTFPHWLKFWQSVKGIGGHTPHKEHHPQNLKSLKSVLTGNQATVTYDIIYCLIER